MPIRLLAVDLDGTLLNSRWEISSANHRALAAASDQGVHLVVVTGRRFHSARRLVAQIPCSITLITSNGARIGSLSGEVYHRHFLPLAVAREVLELATEYRPYAVAIFDTPPRGQVLMEENAAPEGPLGWYLNNNPGCLDLVPDLVEAITCDPIQIMFGGTPARIEPIDALLRASRVRHRVQLSWTKYPTREISLLDVMDKGCSKGTALELWAERCGVGRSEIMAIGDNYNDLEMLEFAGHPVVMGNRSAGLAREGWHETLSNDQDGVAAAIQAYILNAEK